MGLFGGTQASVELQLPDPARVAWRSLREVIAEHPKVVGAFFNEITMCAEFKTDATFATYGQSMSAVVSSDESGTSVLIEGVAKQRSTGGRDSARIRKIAEEILSDLQARLFQVAFVEPDPEQPRTLRGCLSARRWRSSSCCAPAGSSRTTSSRITSAGCSPVTSSGVSRYQWIPLEVRNDRRVIESPSASCAEHAERPSRSLFLRTTWGGARCRAPKRSGPDSGRCGGSSPPAGRSGTTSSTTRSATSASR